MIQELFGKLIDTFELYRGTGKILVLFVLALAVIFALRKESAKDDAVRLPLWSFLLMGVNTVAFAVARVGKMIFDKFFEKSHTERILKILAALVLLYCISISGIRMLSGDFLSPAENSMHIPQKYVDVMDELLSLEDNPAVLAEPSFMKYFPVYSSRFVPMYVYPNHGDLSLLREDDRDAYQMLADHIPDMALVSTVAHRNGVKYIVLKKNFYFNAFPITEYGFEELRDVGDYVIYRIVEGGDYIWRD